MFNQLLLLFLNYARYKRGAAYDRIDKFQKGQVVRIIEGKFKGVTGTVARYQGQQRVGIVIDGLLTVATAYVPSVFLKKNE